MTELESASPLVKGLLIAAGVSGVALVASVALFLVRLISRLAALLGPTEEQKAAKQKAAAKAKTAAWTAANPQQQAVRSNGRERGPDLKTLILEEKKAAAKKGASKDDQASHHPLFLNTLKGHADTVHSVSWSADGKGLVTACEDMLVRVFDVSDVTNRDPKFRRVKAAKTPVGAGAGDSPDAVVVLMRGIPDAILSGYAPSKNAATQGAYEAQWTATNVHGKETPMVLRVVPTNAAAGRRGVAVSCSTKKDARVYDLSGRELATLEPNSLTNHELALSDDGRFVAVASFTSEVKIWEIKRARDTGEFAGAFKAMELKGHKSQVMCVAFSPDSKRAVTVSKDNTLRVWNIDVRYQVSEDPKTTLVIAMPLAAGRCYQRLAFGPNGVIAASHEGTVHLISATGGDLLDSIDAHDSTITCMQWCPVKVRVAGEEEPVAVLATSSRDKRVRLWRSP